MTIPNEIVNNTIADADEVMTNFNYLDEKINVEHDDDGIHQDIVFTDMIERQGIINGGMQVSQEDVAGTKALANNTAKYACDLISVTPSGTAVSAGTQAQISNSTLGRTGKALKLAGVTITGSGTIKWKYRMEAADAIKYKDQLSSFAMQMLHDAGVSLNYTIQINKADVADVFSAVTQIAISGNLPVASGVGTRIELENVAMGACSNGIEIVVTCICGAVTTKNFETTEWQMNIGSRAFSFVHEYFAKTLEKVMRHYEKSFDYSVVPTNNAALMNSIWSVGATAGQTTDGNDVFIGGRYKVPKRTAPSLWFYGSASAANNRWVYYTFAAPSTPVEGNMGSLSNANTLGFDVGGSFSGAGSTTIRKLMIAWTADARFTA